MYYRKKVTNSKPMIEVQVRQTNIIVDTFIPMLANLSFITRKHKDFLDWMLVADLIYRGKHLTEA